MKDNTHNLECIKASLLFTMEYDELWFIPNFEIRIDTAKKNAIALILDNCDCNKCCVSADYILNLNFNDHE